MYRCYRTMEIALDQKQTQHTIGLIVSLIGLGLFVFFGKGVVLYGALMGFGMFATLLLVGLRTPRILKWANDHAAATEIITTGGTFVLFSFVGGGTVTAGIASAVVCLLVSAVLGCSKLGFLDRLIGKATEGLGDGLEFVKDQVTSNNECRVCGDTITPEQSEHTGVCGTCCTGKKATMPPKELKRAKRKTRSGSSILQAAMARAVAKGA